MRLCFISNPNNPHTYRWVNWFARREHTVTLICDTPLRLKDRYPGVTLVDLPSRFNVRVVKYILWAWQVRRLLRRLKPDILHAHRVTGAGWVGALAGFHPFVLTPWGSDLFQYPYRSSWRRWLTIYVVKRADLITANSQALIEQAILFGGNPQRCHVVQWGVDTQIHNPEGDKSKIKDELGIRYDPVILSPRGPNPVYNLELIVKAIPGVLANYPKAGFLFLNYNPDPAYRDKLIKLIDSLGIVEAVQWMEPVEAWEETADIYRAADVAVSVPLTDSSSAAVLEAMACGIPVVASDIPAMREWIVPGENGYLVPADDPAALAEAIQTILRNTELKAQFSEYNQAMLRKRADHQAEMTRMEGLYLALLDKAG